MATNTYDLVPRTDLGHPYTQDDPISRLDLFDLCRKTHWKRLETQFNVTVVSGSRNDPVFISHESLTWDR